MQLLNRWRQRKPSEATPGEVTLIIGLGNPGRKYARDRHNFGFQIAEHFVSAHELAFTKTQGRAVVAIGRVGDQRMVVAKPQTYMNDSGRAVSALLNFYKVPLDRLLVMFDDLDLPFGTIRLRSDGGAGGHNGMRSIIGQLGTNQFPRLRAGVGRPPGRMDPAAFVLQDFSDDELRELPGILERAVQAVDTFLAADIATAMNKFNANPMGDK
jgi:PTH1 family peptidyl-tRNA hydrolase